MADPLGCGDLIAWRRFAYGKALAGEGDFAAAAEMFAQALDQAPNWPPAWFALAKSREKLGDLEGAAEAFRRALEADPSDAQRAAARLAVIGQGDSQIALPLTYVQRLFDGYAPRFDAHLTDALDYRGPALIVEALEAAAPGRRFASALDVGCGTGLMGKALRERVGRLAGVDLSPAMIARAGGRGCYDALAAADAASYLRNSAPGSFDCIVAADAFPYFGDLAPIFAACRHGLAAGGLFAFTAESGDGSGFRLMPALRFSHTSGYVLTVAKDAGFHPLIVRSAWARREAKAHAPGLVVVLAP